MKIVLLDGDKIAEMKDIHRVFAKALCFPPETGKNLDALHDKLTESRDEIGVVLVNIEGLQEAAGRRWKSFLRLLAELEKEREGFYYSIPFEEE